MTVKNRNRHALNGCDVLPPMDPTEISHKTQQADPKRKPNRRKTGNRFAVLNTFVDTAAGGLTRSEILVWLVLYRDTRNEIAQTSQADIARRAKISSRTVRYAIGRLIGRGMLTLVYRGGINRGPSKYQVLADLNAGPLGQ